MYYGRMSVSVSWWDVSECIRHDVVSFCVLSCVSLCTGHFVMVPLNMTYLHCVQHSLFEHLFNLYYDSMSLSVLW